MPNHKLIQKIQHPYLSYDYGNDTAKQKAALYAKKKMTPSEYIDAMSGAYGHNRYDLDRMGINENHPHSTPVNNDRALERLVRDFKAPGGTRTDHHYTERLIDNIIGNHQLPKERLSDILENPKKYGDPYYFNRLPKQKELTKDHIRKLMNHKDFTSYGDLIEHPQMDKETIDEALNDPKKAKDLAKFHHALLGTARHNDPNKRLIDQSGIEKIIRSGLDERNADKWLGALEPEKDMLGNEDNSKRQNVMSDILGMNGGKHAIDINDAENPDHANYDNWQNGPHYNKKQAQAIAGSKYLTPEQIDHIKRHGDIDQKYALFHNKDIDPKHAEEMYNHWTNDDIDKGYGLDQLRDKIKEENPYSDYADDYHQDAIEQAQENYPFSRYLSDNASDEDIIGKSRDEWINEYLDENHDWNHTPDQQNSNEEPEEEDFSGDKENHPDYQARYDEADKAYDNALQEAKENAPESLYEDYDNYLNDDVSQIALDLYDKDMESAHENPDFLPKHLPSVEEIKRKKREQEELKAQIKAKEEEQRASAHLDSQVPKRAHAHPYGDLQHHVELAKQFADANGGSIDIGHLNKMYPNMKDKWKQVFGPKGKLTSQELDQKWQDIPKTPYAISHRTWESGLQNINERPQTVFRLDHTPESMAPIKADPEAHKAFNKIADISQRSGHPTNANTIAWSRVDTTDPKHWMIDEVQSDFGSAARDYLAENGKQDEADAVNKVIDYHKNWREALINHVLNEAKKHGVETVSTHSPESKAAHTGANKVHTVYKDSYGKVPKNMGFRPTSMENLPLTEEGKNEFRKGRSSGTPTSALVRMHEMAMLEHAKNHKQHAHLRLNPENPENQKAHADLAEHHYNMYQQHQQRLSQLDPSHAFRNSKTPDSLLRRQEFDNESAMPYSVDTEPEYRDLANRMATSVSEGNAKMPVISGDEALKQQPQVQSGNPGHQINLTEQAFKKHMLDLVNLMKNELDLYVNHRNMDYSQLESTLSKIKELRSKCQF